jgi:glycosyltransferase involved in cell wall biosynthesis
MRVVSLIDSLAPGGAERSLVEMAPHLRSAGIDLTVAVLYDRDGYADELRDCGVALEVLPPHSRPGGVRSVRELLGRVRPDLLHTTLYEADVVGRLAGASRRCPVLCTIANVRYGPEQYAEPGLSTTKLRASQAVDIVTARLVRRFHAVSTNVADTMAPALRVPRDRVEVIPRGRDGRRLGRRTDERRAAARQLLEIDPDRPLVLAIARHEHQKGLDLLIRAAEELRRRDPHPIVVVAGSQGRQTETLRRLVTEVGLEDDVVLLGARPDVPELLCAADVFVLPSRREGFPGAVIEAMALEAPLVVADIPMVREAVPDARFAAFVQPLDPRSLTEALTSTLDDPDAARDRARAARRRFEEEFTIEAVSQRMADLFGRVARR